MCPDSLYYTVCSFLLTLTHSIAVNNKYSCLMRGIWWNASLGCLFAVSITLKELRDIEYKLVSLVMKCFCPADLFQYFCDQTLVLLYVLIISNIVTPGVAPQVKSSPQPMSDVFSCSLSESQLFVSAAGKEERQVVFISSCFYLFIHVFMFCLMYLFIFVIAFVRCFLSQQRLSLTSNLVALCRKTRHLSHSHIM